MPAARGRGANRERMDSETKYSCARCAKTCAQSECTGVPYQHWDPDEPAKPYAYRAYLCHECYDGLPCECRYKDILTGTRRLPRHGCRHAQCWLNYDNLKTFTRRADARE